MHEINLLLLPDLGYVRNISSLIFPNLSWLSLPPTRWLRNPSSICMGGPFPFFLSIHLWLYRKPGLQILGRASGLQSNTLEGFVLHSEVQVVMCVSAQGSVLRSQTAALEFRLSRCLCRKFIPNHSHVRPWYCWPASVWSLLLEELTSITPLCSLPASSSILRNSLLLPHQRRPSLPTSQLPLVFPLPEQFPSLSSAFSKVVDGGALQGRTRS